MQGRNGVTGNPGRPGLSPPSRPRVPGTVRVPPWGRVPGAEFIWLTETPQDEEEQRGGKGGRPRTGVFSGEVGTVGEKGDQRLEKSLLGTSASYKYRLAGERSADTSHAPSSHLSLGGVSRVFLPEDRTVSLHPACSLRACVPFRIMPCHPPLSTEGVEGTGWT